jgi:hypothetical protein
MSVSELLHGARRLSVGRRLAPCFENPSCRTTNCASLLWLKHTHRDTNPSTYDRIGSSLRATGAAGPQKLSARLRQQSPRNSCEPHTYRYTHTSFPPGWSSWNWLKSYTTLSMIKTALPSASACILTSFLVIAGMEPADGVPGIWYPPADSCEPNPASRPILRAA